MPVSGILAERLGWPAVFYIYGFFGLIWFAMWLYFISDKPDDDPWISSVELDFIKQSLIADTQKTEVCFLNYKINGLIYKLCDTTTCVSRNPYHIHGKAY